jgi:ABC-type branched-subunit amino acid transport system substrate-binding protein
MRRPLLMPSLVLSTTLVLAACGKGGSSDSATGNAGGASAAPSAAPAATSDAIKTDHGVTDKEITLGVLTDNTGPFKDLGLGFLHGQEMWRDAVNPAGGICGRQIKFETRDSGYKADTAKVLFPEIEPKSVGFLQLLGSPVIAALGPDITAAKVTTLAVSWSSELLSNPYVVIAGATYDLEQINGLSYLMDQKLIKDGDTIGAIYIDGEYGANGLRGVNYFAQQHKLTVKTAKVTSTDTDMKGIITGFKGDKVKAIALTTSPTQSASAASNDVALGLNVPLLGNNPTFAPSLMTTPAADALSHLYIAASAVPFSSDVPKATELAADYLKKYPNDTPTAGVMAGYAFGEIWAQILKQACTNKDLTRDGIQAALKQSTNITTDKLIADLDFSKAGSPSAREVYIAQPDKAEKGGLKQVKPLFESADAKTYKAPHEQ